MSERHLTALIGMNTTRKGPCVYVAAGGGVYAIRFRDLSFRSPGIALAAGTEFPTGARGAIQMDATLHVINSRHQRTITPNEVLTLNLVVGWAYRF